jgi:hypothetical protein
MSKVEEKKCHSLPAETLRSMASRTFPEEKAERFSADLARLACLTSKSGQEPNWVVPDASTLAAEFLSEYSIASTFRLYGDLAERPSDSLEFLTEFVRVRGEMVSFSPGEILAMAGDATTDMPPVKDLANLLWVTSSYHIPKDLPRIAEGLVDGSLIPTPIFMRRRGGEMVVCGGRTRSMAAALLGLTVRGIVIDEVAAGLDNAARSVGRLVAKISQVMDTFGAKDLAAHRGRVEAWSEEVRAALTEALGTGNAMTPPRIPELPKCLATTLLEEAVRGYVRKFGHLT